MSEPVEVDDQGFDPVHRINYFPSRSWRGSAPCEGCGLTNNDAALGLLRQTAFNGTWNAAGYLPNQPERTLTATLEFQGSSVAVNFILFFRALAPNATGRSNLTFLIDDIERNSTAILYENFTFNSHNFTPQLTLFRAPDLDPNVPHKIQIQWTHNGTMPPIVVALDSILLTGVPLRVLPSSTVAANLTPTVMTSPSNNDAPNQQSNDSAKRIAAIVVPIVVLLAIVLGILAWWFKRRHRKFAPTDNAPVLVNHSEHRQWSLMAPFTPGPDPYGANSPAAPGSSTLSSTQPPSYLESVQLPQGGGLGEVGGYRPFVKDRGEANRAMYVVS